MTRMIRSTVGVVLSIGLGLSSLAHAQALPGVPGEPRCKTTTTVECTGAAATAAVPYADGVQPPPPAYPPAPQAYPPPPAYPPAPPAYPPPQAYPPGAYGQPFAAPTVMPLGDGWKLGVDESGRPVVERRRRLGRTGLWAAGLTLFLGMPLVTGFGLAVDSNAQDKWFRGSMSVLPIIGMWVNAGIESSTSRYAYDCYDYCPSYNNRGRVAGWAIAGLVQASGFAMFLVGLGTGPEKIERFPLRFSAGPAPDGGMQFGMNGKF